MTMPPPPPTAYANQAQVNRLNETALRELACARMGTGSYEDWSLGYLTRETIIGGRVHVAGCAILYRHDKSRLAFKSWSPLVTDSASPHAILPRSFIKPAETDDTEEPA